MNPEAMRVAIAEACGYRFFHTDRETILVPADHSWPERPYFVKRGVKPGDGRPAKPFTDQTSIPNYLFSLDAMHEAEETLNYKQLEKMHNLLAHVITHWTPKKRGTAHDFIWHATAAQRAEAFLRAIGKYKEAA